MAKILPIVLHPHPALRAKAQPVAAVDDALRALLDDMVESLHAANGVGLAAPQVAVNRRAIVLHTDVEGEAGERGYRPGSKPLKLINPRIVRQSPELIESEEGCLSIPMMYDIIQRHAAVRVEYVDENGDPREIEGEGLLGRALQHEIDHLDGVLFLDHLSRLKRDLMVKKYRKAYDGFGETLEYPFVTSKEQP